LCFTALSLPSYVKASNPLENPEPNVYSQNSVYYSEKIFDNEGGLFSESTIGPPWIIDNEGKVIFLNNDNMAGPNDVLYLEIIGSDSLNNKDEEFGYRSFVAMAPSNAIHLENGEEFEALLRSMNVDEETIGRLVSDFGVIPQSDKPDYVVTPLLQQQLDQSDPDDFIEIIIELTDNP